MIFNVDGGWVGRGNLKGLRSLKLIRSASFQVIPAGASLYSEYELMLSVLWFKS